MAPPVPHVPVIRRMNKTQREAMSKLVMKCLQDLRDNATWTTKNVVKYIKHRHTVDVANIGCTGRLLGRQVGLVMKRCVKRGIVVGNNLGGKNTRYRLPVAASSERGHFDGTLPSLRF